MVFPDDLRESNPGTFKFLQMAQAWKAKGSLLAPPPSAVSGNSEVSRTEENANQDGDQDEASSDGDVDMDERDDAS